MLFTSPVFVFFTSSVAILYYFAPNPLRHKEIFQPLFLTLASMVFYGWHSPMLVILLSTSLFVNGLASRYLLQPYREASTRRLILILGVAANLGALAFFKYASMLVSTFLPSSWVRGMTPFLREIPLPVGISFYTLQGLSLLIDSYKRRTEGMEGLLNEIDGHPLRLYGKISFYISFFPRLMAGPISKAHEFVNQIGPKGVRDIDWNDAQRKLITGFFLKMVVADNLKEVTDAIGQPTFLELSSVTLLALLYGYSFQIFADFAGYSLIAMGLGRLFGYRFPVNFEFPYLSESLTEFWRRWHISLTSWLREYLYIPLGGNREGALRTYFNIFVVMFLCGLWHGAAWGFAVWGTAHGILLAAERLFRNRFGVIRKGRPRMISRFLRIFMTFNIVTFLWLPFRLGDFHQEIEYLRIIARGTYDIKPQMIFVLLFFSIPVVMYHIWGATAEVRSQMRNLAGSRLYSLIESSILALMLFMILVNFGAPSAFIYFQF